MTNPNYQSMLEVAIAEAQRGLDEGGIPIGAALFHSNGQLLGCGHNRRVQEGDPSVTVRRMHSARPAGNATTATPSW